MNMSNSINPALADRFDPSTLQPPHLAIRRLYNSSEPVLDQIYKTLRMPAILFPSVGCIYNKHVRVRSKAAAARETGPTSSMEGTPKSPFGTIILDDKLYRKLLNFKE